MPGRIPILTTDARRGVAGHQRKNVSTKCRYAVKSHRPNHALWVFPSLHQHLNANPITLLAQSLYHQPNGSSKCVERAFHQRVAIGHIRSPPLQHLRSDPRLADNNTQSPAAPAYPITGASDQMQRLIKNMMVTGDINGFGCGIVQIGQPLSLRRRRRCRKYTGLCATASNPSRRLAWPSAGYARLCRPGRSDGRRF